MNQSKKYILQVTIVALMLNSTMPAQAIDWSYWSNCAREGVSGFAASMPSKNQVIDRLKQPKVLGALAVVSVVAAVGLYYMNSTSQQQSKQPPKPKQLSLEEIAEHAQALLSSRYALNRRGSKWQIKGDAGIWKVTRPEYDALAQQYKGEDLWSALDRKYEYIDLSNYANLTPETLQENKPYIKLFCNLKGINLEQLNTYINVSSI